MERYSFTQEEVVKLLDDAMDLFMEFQYKHGYEEPKARMEAIRAILDLLVEGKRDKTR